MISWLILSFGLLWHNAYLLRTAIQKYDADFSNKSLEPRVDCLQNSYEEGKRYQQQADLYTLINN